MTREYYHLGSAHKLLSEALSAGKSVIAEDGCLNMTVLDIDPYDRSIPFYKNLTLNVELNGQKGPVTIYENRRGFRMIAIYDFESGGLIVDVNSDYDKDMREEE